MPRYKLVVQVTIGESKHQGAFIASRCLWNPATDNYCTLEYKNVRGSRRLGAGGAVSGARAVHPASGRERALTPARPAIPLLLLHCIWLLHRLRGASGVPGGKGGGHGV